MRTSRYSTLLRCLLALVALAGVLYWAQGAEDRFAHAWHRDRFIEPPFHIDEDTAKIDDPTPAALSAGLTKDVQVVSLDGSPYTGQAQAVRMFNLLRPGDIITVGYRRPDGSTGAATIVLEEEHGNAGTTRNPTRNPAQLWQMFTLFNLMPLICMSIGYWVVFAKPNEPNAWLLLVLLVFPGVVFNYWYVQGGSLLFRLFYYNFFQIYGPLALLPFAIYFPERSRLDVKLPWIKWLIGLPVLFFGLFQAFWVHSAMVHPSSPAWLMAARDGIDRIENALNLVCVVLYFVILADKLISASTEDARRRLRVLLTGTGIGLGALLLVFVLLPDLGFDRNAPGHAWVSIVGCILFLLAPLTLAYVVLVQRAMDVSILVRQGTRYALARGTIWAVQAGILAYLGYRVLLPILTEQQVPVSDLRQGVLFAFLLLMFSVVFRKQSRNWLDKKFFREAYDSEQVLSQLSDEVRKFRASGPLFETVAKCVAETLHVGRIGMFLRSGGDYALAEAVGVPEDRGAYLLPASSSTIRNLGRTNAPARLYRENPDAWYMLADEVERRTLDQLGAELLLPLPGRDRLMGVMALGPKQSEAAYSKSDLHLLQVLAAQTGMALEVSELAHSLADEATRRERAHREMEIAREVQERLFPQTMPKLACGSIAGACRPAQGVGGDYYDVFPLEDGRVGIAIGDVSGKGISAALLMASLRASLRGVTLDSPREFAKLMEKVNRLVYEASADNRYATFFFGALDPATLLLECVNAGHNAPLVLRQNGAADPETLRIEADGPVVGLLPWAPYQEQTLQMQPGDLLVTYTDGISEAMTRDDEEWGEERMMAAASSAPEEADAGEVVKAIFAAADRFTSGAPQHDDMTLLVLKLDRG